MNPRDCDGATSIIGHYAFKVGNNTIYVLWGGEIPKEISGKVKITDIYGNVRIADSSEIILSDTPIYLELIE